MDASVNIDRRTRNDRYAIRYCISTICDVMYTCIHILVGTKGYTCVRITRGFICYVIFVNIILMQSSNYQTIFYDYTPLQFNSIAID